MESINLNLIPTGANPVVHVSQYDTGRVIRFNIFEGSSVYFLDGTETIACNIKKPDNNIVTLSVTNTNDSYVEITTTEQATACDGSNLCEISITKGDDVIGSLNFIMEVERSPIEGGISSASEINNLWTQVDGMVADALATQYDSANVVFDNLPTEGHGIPYTVTSEGIGNAIDNALDMTAEASGAIATFESEYALPIRNLEIEINAVQESGTPTPNSPKAISGFTGANIKVAGNLLNGNKVQVGDRTVRLGELAGNTYSTHLLATTYTISFIRPTDKAFRFDLIDSNNTVTTLIPFSSTNNSVTFDISTEGDYCFSIYLYAGVSPSDIDNVMLVGGSEVKPYTPYTTPTTAAITWQDEAGTVYGGSLDVTSGKFTVDISDKLDLGDLSWGYNSNYGGIFYAQTSASHTKGQAILCDCYKTTTISIDAPNTDWNSVSDLTIGLHYQGGVNYIYVKNSNYTDAVAFASAMAGHKYITALANANTYQLTPTPINANLGTNNVFTDTNGDTSLEYYTKRGEQTVRIAEGVAVDVINNKNIDNLTTTNKTLVGAVNEVNSGVANSVRRYTTSWGTTCQTTIGRYQFLVLRGFTPYAVWLASTNDINVANIANNTSANGTGSVTFDNVVFTRLSNNNLKVELSSNGTITIFG